MALKKFPQLNDREWLVERYNRPMSMYQIAEEIGCSYPAVNKAFKKLGIEARPAQGPEGAGGPVQFASLDDREWLNKRYTLDGLSMERVGREVGCTGGAVLKALRRHGIPTRPSKGRGRRTPEPPAQLRDPDWLDEQFRRQRRTIGSIAKEVGTGRGPVGSALRRFGISRKYKLSSPMRQATDRVFPRLGDAAWLQTEYIDKNRAYADIAAELGCTAWAVQAALCRFRLLKYPGRPQEKKDPSLGVGVKRDTKGYLRNYMPDHPFACRGWVFQHRVMVEEAIGRYLTPEEEVHHLNERRDDNRLSNFILMPDYRTHVLFHKNPPAWVPRCECCGHLRPELVTGRPEGVPLVYDHVLCYGAA